eukprot:m.125615 g.125615  ORF g.125615 m.125615 type:complete len:76 (-) comp16655_c1_seq2:152-379(-)
MCGATCLQRTDYKCHGFASHRVGGWCVEQEVRRQAEERKAKRAEDDAKRAAEEAVGGVSHPKGMRQQFVTAGQLH